MNAIETPPLEVAHNEGTLSSEPSAPASFAEVSVGSDETAACATANSGDFRGAVRDFFHGLEMPHRLALVRICLAVTLVFPMAYRWFYAREIFSTDGAGISLWSIYDYPCPWLEPSGTVAVALTSVVVLALITSGLGWCTRLSLVVATTGYTYLNLLDILGTLNKSSAIASHFLLLLCFSQCGAVWSIDSWLARRRLLRAGMPPELIPGPAPAPRWPRRMMQIVLAAVYLSAALTKFQIRAYFTGEHLETWMLSTIHTPNLLGGYLAFHPAIVVLGAYATAMWELLFAFLIWKPMARRVMLPLGVFFHVMTCLTLGLFIFPMICLSSYAAFTTESEFDTLRRTVANLWRRVSFPFATGFRGLANLSDRLLPDLGPAGNREAFAVVLICTGVGGAVLEHKLDRFGERRSEGPYALQEVDPQDVAELITPTRRIEPEDKILNFDVGSVFVAGCLLDRRTTFRQGETVRVQCGLIPPHESTWIQCNLHDSQNRVVDTIGLFLSCDMLRALFYYNLGDCVKPGDYSLVLKLAGEEIMRRPITVLPRTTACAVNQAPMAN
jgi:hypothetical protein